MTMMVLPSEEAIPATGLLDRPNRLIDRPDGSIELHEGALAQRERAWHDDEAERRVSLDRVLYRAPAFDAVVQCSLNFLDVRPGERVLDVGAGEGKEALMFAHLGSHVVAVDVSERQLARTWRLVSRECDSARLSLVQGSAEELPFRDGAFRVIYGKAILHHVHVINAAAQVNRVLEPRGRASFTEPLNRHPLFWLARRLTPTLRSADERPLTIRELRSFGLRFHRAEEMVWFFLAPIAFPLRMLPGGETLFRAAHRLLGALDAMLLGAFPAVRHLCWYGQINVEK